VLNLKGNSGAKGLTKFLSNLRCGLPDRNLPGANVVEGSLTAPYFCELHKMFYSCKKVKVKVKVKFTLRTGHEGTNEE